MRRVFWLGIAFLPLSVLAQIPVVFESGKFQRIFLNEDGTPFELRGPTADHGDVAVVGDPGSDAFGRGVGAVHVFRRQPGGSDELWIRTHTLEPASPRLCEGFGAVVAIRGDVIVAGTRQTSEFSFAGCGQSPVPIANRTRVFERQAAAWAQTLEVRDDVSGPYAIEDDYIVVGEQPSATVYQRMAPGVWSAGVVLPVPFGSQLNIDFPGVNVSTSGNRVALGGCTSPFSSDDLPTLTCYHRAVVYERDDQGNWALLADVVSDQWERLGRTTVSIAGEALAVGAQLYALDTYDTYPVANLSAHTDSATVNSAATMHANGAIVTVRSSDVYHDVYRRGADGFWRPAGRFRLSDGSALSSLRPKGDDRFVGAGEDGFFYNFELPDTIHAPTISQLRAMPDVIRAGEIVELTAAADNFGVSSASIQKLEFSIDTTTWQPMTPLDGAYDGLYEAASAHIPIGQSLAAGHLRICVRATDADGNTAEMLNRDSDLNNCPVVQIVLGDQTLDNLPPIVYEPQLYRSRVIAGQDNSIYVFADDTSSGGSRIQSVQYQVDGGPWRLMKPVIPRTAFAAQGVATFAVLPPIGAVGVHSICVRAIDTAGNLGTHPCQSFEVAP